MSLLTLPHQGMSVVHGNTVMRVISPNAKSNRSYKPMNPLELVEKYALPMRHLQEEVNEWRKKNIHNLKPSIQKFKKAEKHGIPFFCAALYLTKFTKEGEELFFGLAGFRVVTTVGVGFIVDAFQNSVELENMKFHGIGTGSTAEAVGDTALVTELTTEYNPDNTRATGSTTEGASANIYRTIGTNTLDGAGAIVEHGIFSSATVGAGVLLDRTVFSVINLSASDALQSQYDMTLSAGS